MSEDRYIPPLPRLPIEDLTPLYKISNALAELGCFPDRNDRSIPSATIVLKPKDFFEIKMTIAYHAKTFRTNISDCCWTPNENFFYFAGVRYEKGKYV